jgi:hypothetical protein
VYRRAAGAALSAAGRAARKRPGGLLAVATRMMNDYRRRAHQARVRARGGSYWQKGSRKGTGAAQMTPAQRSMSRNMRKKPTSAPKTSALKMSGGQRTAKQKEASRRNLKTARTKRGRGRGQGQRQGARGAGRRR